ncbi:MAG: plastocyanin/azurin family copper-binding protein [Acidimicrobiales bacterium]
MECEAWAEPLSAWVDGELLGAPADDLEAHLATCAGCRAAAERWGDLRRRSLLQGGAVAPEPAPVLAAVAAQRRAVGRTLALRLGAAAAALVAFTAVVGARSSSPTAGEHPPAHVASTVDAYSRQFSQGRVVVPVGTTVTWKNRTSTTHELVNEVAAGQVTATLGPGQADAVTFSRPGTYEYRCDIHRGMRGQVVVE